MKRIPFSTRPPLSQFPIQAASCCPALHQPNRSPFSAIPDSPFHRINLAPNPLPLHQTTLAGHLPAVLSSKGSATMRSSPSTNRSRTLMPRPVWLKFKSSPSKSCFRVAKKMDPEYVFRLKFLLSLAWVPILSGAAPGFMLASPFNSWLFLVILIPSQ